MFSRKIAAGCKHECRIEDGNVNIGLKENTHM